MKKIIVRISLLIQISSMYTMELIPTLSPFTNSLSPRGEFIVTDLDPEGTFGTIYTKTILDRSTYKKIGYLIATLLESNYGATINQLYINENYRKKGYASLLLDEVLSDMNRFGYERVILNVLQTNKPAIALYTKYGFGDRKTRGRYFLLTKMFIDENKEKKENKTKK